VAFTSDIVGPFGDPALGAGVLKLSQGYALSMANQTPIPVVINVLAKWAARWSRRCSGRDMTLVGAIDRSPNNIRVKTPGNWRVWVNRWRFQTDQFEPMLAFAQERQPE